MCALDFLGDDLATLEASGLARTLRTLRGRQESTIDLDGRNLVNFASNNYLGLAAHPALAAAAADAALRLGTGSGGSRLIVGNLELHEALESEVARFHEAEAALLFNSGYQANVGLMSSLPAAGDLIVSDALNHASLIDGCRLSRARVEVYRHGDLDHAAHLLAGMARRRFVVSESVFSMDGDIADVGGLAELARRAGAVLVLDEAHAVGALGPGGRGIAAAAGVVPDVLVGTFGKAFGSFGAYVAGPADLRRWLVSRARSFVFTTGLPATVVAASRSALELVRSRVGDERRRDLARSARQLRAGIRSLGKEAGKEGSPIVPWLIGDEAAAMEATAHLADQGVYAQGIRPPTVPRGTSRLRITAMATHSEAQIAQLCRVLGGLDVPRGTLAAK